VSAGGLPAGSDLATLAADARAQGESMAAVARRLGVDRKALVAALDADGLAWRRHRPDELGSQHVV